MGFPDGYKDLGKLMHDAKSSVLTNAGLSSDGSRILQKGFDPLISLRRPLEDLDHLWNSAVADSDNSPLGILEYGRKLIEDGHLAESDRKSAMDKFEGCDQSPNGRVLILTELTNLQAKLDKMSEAVQKLSSFEYIDKFKDMKPYKDIVAVLDSISLQEKESKALKVVTDLLALPDFQEMFGLFEKYFKDLVYLHTFVTDFNTAANQITDAEFDSVGTYLNAHSTTWSTIYNCLRNEVKHGDELAKEIRVVQAVRKLQGSPEIQKTMKFMDTFGNTMNSLAELQTLASEDLPSDDTLDKIKLFYGSMSMARGLGSAVQGLIAMKKALDFQNKDHFTELKTETLKVRAEADKFRSRLSTEDYQEIGKLEVLNSELNAIFEKVEDVRIEVENLSSESSGKLADNFKVFQIADKVPNLTVDVEKVRKAVGNLAALNPNSKELDKTGELLAKIESLNLNFSSFQFSAASGPLESLQHFFQDLTFSLQPQMVINETTTPYLHSPRKLEIPEVEGTESNNAVVFIIVGLVCFCIMTVTGAWVSRRKYEHDEPIENRR